MKLTVFSSDGKTSSEKEFSGLPTFEGDRGLQAVKEVIVAINANNRLGTHSTKRPVAKSAAAVRSRGARRVPAVPEPAPSARPCGSVVASSSAPGRATTPRRSTPR